VHSLSRLFFAAAIACVPGASPVSARSDRPDPAVLDSMLAMPAADPTGTLTLEGALRLSVRHHPALQGAAWRIRAAAARARDAGRWANPDASLEVENLGGDPERSRREATLSLGQRFELGGDRGARAEAAQTREALAWVELTAEERAVLAVTSERFIDAWALQERLVRLTAAERLAAQAVEAAAERFRAGAGPAVERIRAEAVLASRQAERLRARAQLAAARRRLASQWGATEQRVDSLFLPLPSPTPIPAADSLVARLERHPERRRAAAEVAVEAARLREARAARVPDLQLSAGVRHLDEDGAIVMNAGASLPLPLWGTPRDAEAAAESERAAAAAHERFVRLRLAEELHDALERYLAASEGHRLIAERVRPKAAEALEQITAGYRGGRFGSLELLEAQRTVIEAELSWVEATAESWRARTLLERLLGASLEDLGKEDGR
jgi:cobalt-zinc-cadmium efflux system outer membrane protein